MRAAIDYRIVDEDGLSAYYLHRWVRDEVYCSRWRWQRALPSWAGLSRRRPGERRK